LHAILREGVLTEAKPANLQGGPALSHRNNWMTKIAMISETAVGTV